jgi:hypothetical protein
MTISAFFVGDIAARLALYGALKPRGARQFFEGWLNRVDFSATVLDVVIWSINVEERATGASQSARGARLVRFLRVGRAITRVGRAAAASARVAKNVLLKKSEDELRRLDGVLLTADEVTITAPAPSEALVADRAGKESEIPNFKGSSLGRFPLVLAEFWTSDHLVERPRSVDDFSGTRARGTLTLKRT